jgi:dipeptidyl aminopeptidase/acylaminoacyl peptidase
VPFQQIPPFVEAAKRSPHPGASVEYHAYPGEGHGMAGTATQAEEADLMYLMMRSPRL